MQQTAPIVHSTQQHRTDIQGLRAVAIGSVVVFHIWSSWFPLGFLGVDVFFVISGFLMFSILTRRRLTPLGALDFYFRRFRRIVPLYLSLVIGVLVAAVILVHPFEYEQLLGETFPSILYFSNCPAVHGSSYFDLKSNNLFFQHSWSLATELQFYAVVPALFALFQFLGKVHGFFSWSLVVYLWAVSFWRQSVFYTRLDSEHMAPDARLWQFASGFLVHAIRDSGVFDRLRSDAKSDSTVELIVKRVVTQLLPSICLVYFLFSTIAADWSRPAMRGTAVGLSVWILVFDSTHPSPLSWTPMRILGDFSYSLYLIHWPLFVMHRYLNPQLYDLDLVAGREIKWTIGCSLIVISVVVGFVVEEVARRLLTKIRSWSSLIGTVFALYLWLAVLIIYIGHHKMFPYDPTPATEDWSREVLREVTLLHEQHAAHLRLGRSESLRLNRDIVKFGIFAPPGNTSRVPTRLRITYAPNLYVQRLTGRGTKNYVVVGNSHALCAMHGLRLYFANEYANLTLYSATACMLMPDDKQIPDARTLCSSYMRELIPALRQWEHPIDVIFVFFGYARVPDYPIEGGSLERDPMFQLMQTFYSDLSSIARDLVFASNVSMHFRVDQIRIVQQRLHDRKSPSEIGTTRQEQLDYLPTMRQRMSALTCSRCIPIQFLDLWCDGRQADSFCRSVDSDTRLVYFADYHHVSVYGSLFQGQFLRRLYDEYGQKQMSQ